MFANVKNKGLPNTRKPVKVNPQESQSSSATTIVDRGNERVSSVCLHCGKCFTKSFRKLRLKMHIRKCVKAEKNPEDLSSPKNPSKPPIVQQDRCLAKHASFGAGVQVDTSSTRAKSTPNLRPPKALKEDYPVDAASDEVVQPCRLSVPPPKPRETGSHQMDAGDIPIKPLLPDQKDASAPAERKGLQTSTPSLTSFELAGDAHHGVSQQLNSGQGDDQPTLHSSNVSYCIQEELIKPLVTDFLKQKLVEAMSSRDQAFSETFRVCTEDEFDSESDDLTEYVSDAEGYAATQTKETRSDTGSRPSYSGSDTDGVRSFLIDTSSYHSGRAGSSERGGSSRAHGARVNAEQTQSVGSSHKSRMKRRKKENSPSGTGQGQEGDGESDQDDNERPRRRKISDECVNGKNLACPFYRRHPEANSRATACIYPGFRTIARLKEHLYRQHYRISCPRCELVFKEEDSLKAHLKSKTACESVEGNPNAEYMTSDQKSQLRSKKRKQGENTPERKWEGIYRLLFPNDTSPVPSPYCEPTAQLPSSSPSHLEEFQKFSCEQLRCLLIERMQSELRSLGPIVEARLRESMDEILRQAPTQILRQWQEQRPTSLSTESHASSQKGPCTPPSGSDDRSLADHSASDILPTEPRFNQQPTANPPAEEAPIGHHEGSDIRSEKLAVQDSEGLNEPPAGRAPISIPGTDSGPGEPTHSSPQSAQALFGSFRGVPAMAWENGLEGSVGLSVNMADHHGCVAPPDFPFQGEVHGEMRSQSVFGLDGVDWSNWLDDDAAINALVNDFSNANDRDVSMDHGPGGASQGNVQGRQARGPTGQVEQSGDSVMEDYER